MLESRRSAIDKSYFTIGRAFWQGFSFSNKIPECREISHPDRSPRCMNRHDRYNSTPFTGEICRIFR